MRVTHYGDGKTRTTPCNGSPLMNARTPRQSLNPANVTCKKCREYLAKTEARVSATLTAAIFQADA